jgi:hypothetical protein
MGLHDPFEYLNISYGQKMAGNQIVNLILNH